jgi:hypothetical protein
MSVLDDSPCVISSENQFLVHMTSGNSIQSRWNFFEKCVNKHEIGDEFTDVVNDLKKLTVNFNSNEIVSLL